MPFTRVTSLVAIAILQAYWFLQPVPLRLKVVAALLVIVSMARPAYGVLAFAALSPLSTVIASLFGGPGLGAQLLEQMVLAIGAGTIVASGPRDGGTRIGRPALLMAVVAIASAAAMIPAAAAPLNDGWLLHSSVWSPMRVALTIAQCALLGWAVERTTRRTPRLAATLVLVALVGHAVSAALSIDAVVRAAIRAGDVLEALPRLLMSVRLSVQTDWNAAASAFLLAGIAGLGLIKTRGIQRAGIGLLLVLVAAGLWITGSRIAIVLGVLVTVGTLAWRFATNSRHKRTMAIGAVVLTVGLGTWLTARYPEGRNDKPGDTLRSRLVLMKAGMRMLEEAPVFGIGIDGFYAASATFVEPDTHGTSEPARENAHNNFVQVLAEQGIVGLGALLWWLSVVIVSGARAQVQQPTAGRGALLLGIVACVATWLTGHPLLVPEFAFVFWLYAGTLLAMTPSPEPGGLRWLPWILVAGVVLSVPMRASALRNSANLEYQGLGVSMWQHDDTQRYRNAGPAFALFLPATGRPVEIPIRRAPGAPEPLVVTIRIGDGLVNQVAIDGDAWQAILVTVPQGSRRFELVNFSVDVEATRPGVLLRVGREAAR